MIAVFSGNSNAQFLMRAGSGVRLFALGSERGGRIKSTKNGTRVL
jgi:hypothetical protein